VGLSADFGQAPSLDSVVPVSKYPEEWEADVVLRDGSTCHMRPIRASDADRLRRFHAQLSPETIYTRFFAPYPELTKKDVERFTVVDHDDRVALVATVAGEIVGVGRYDRVADLDAEVAFTVRDDYQGRGLGSVLLEHLAAAARERRVRRFVADVLPQNRRMSSTFSQAGYRVASELEDGIVKLAFEIETTETLRSVARAREQRADSRSIERLLNPSSIAVIGASRRAESMGHQMLQNLVDGGFEGRLLPIHRSAQEVAGLNAYPTVGQAPSPIDLAVIVVPVDQVPGVVADCGEAGVHGIVVVSSGYSDAGPEGVERERALVEMVRGHGMRLVGPNSLGLINSDPHSKLVATVTDSIPPRGKIALFCQSAAISNAALVRLAKRQLGIASFVSGGNRADVTGEDLLQYWLSETHSDLVMMYLETMSDPKKFTRVAAEVGVHKPVVVVRSGRTSQAFPLGPGGRRTQLQAYAVNQLIENTGIVEAGSLGELVDIGGIFACQPLPTGRRVSIVGTSHELVSLAADTAGTAGMIVVKQALVTGEPIADAMAAELESSLDGESADAIIVVHTRTTAAQAPSLGKAVLTASQNSSVPIVGVRHDEEGRNSLLRYGSHGEALWEWSLGEEYGSAPHGSVPVFGTVEEAIRALDSVMRYSTWRTRERGAVPEHTDIDSESVRVLVEEIQARGSYSPDSETVAMSDSEISHMLDCFGIRLWPAHPVATEDQAVAEADAVGWPVALKTLDPRVNRRGSMNGVRLNLGNEAELRAAYLSLAAGLDAYAVSRFVVQSMAPSGVHCVIRSVEDALFGPVVSFGMGGTIAELLGDHSYQMPPITDRDAARLVRGPGASSLLFGYGGNERVDLLGLEDLIVRVGLLADEFPQISRLDLNPIVASPTGPAVLGATAWIRPTEARIDGEARRLAGW
jgi:acyl-CoA synthetase (NDP forming)/GNAT superfamily N-acetyltransferase